ncbi:MAG: glutamate--cysteine ligase [Legionellaceae bacterium]|nr:glutamate--cysteine ligase [Legionellaceae bacterium]
MLTTFIIDHISDIESWFRTQWKDTTPAITTSVDLRYAGFKLAPVDTNLFPAGFNNLPPHALTLSVQAMQAFLARLHPQCREVGIIPESHTRNRFYWESMRVLQDIVEKAGCKVRIGGLQALELPERTIPILEKTNHRLSIDGHEPSFFILNNDLSDGIPEILHHLEQAIYPAPALGWIKRRKSHHFDLYAKVAHSFAEAIGLDPWIITPEHTVVEGVDFMEKTGLEALMDASDQILRNMQKQYDRQGITQAPFVVIKADNGTYGMGIMTIHEAKELQQINRKTRAHMAKSKGNQPLVQVMIQEGIPTITKTEVGSVSEPVVYLIGSCVVGGFYRLHPERGIDENLNSPGMTFEPIPFTLPCNLPSRHSGADAEAKNQFYTYSVIARLAALAAALEQAELPSCN